MIKRPAEKGAGRSPWACLSRRGMTLIEIIVVVAIISILIAIIFPVFGMVRTAAYKTVAISQLEQLGTASTLYSNDFDTRLVPSTNYGVAEEEPERIWPVLLFSYAGGNKGPFIARGSKGMYPGSWALRGWGSFGMNAATSIDPEYGCTDTDEDKTSCRGFLDSAVVDKTANPTLVPLFTTTPYGETYKEYRGYEFNPYNGLPREQNIAESPPLTSDRDLVPELPILPGDLIKAVFARYGADGLDNGWAPILFADGHAKPYQAKDIVNGKTRILWRFR